MAPFSGLRRKIGSIFSSRTSQNITQQRTEARRRSNANLSQSAGASLNESAGPNPESDEYDSEAENADDVEPLGKNKKRKRSSKSAQGSRRSKRTRGLKDASRSHLNLNSLTTLNPPNSEVASKSPVKDKGKQCLMLPPETSLALSEMVPRKSISDNITDLGSLAPSTAIRKEATQLDTNDLEKARRHAEAHKLPADSDDWSQAERDLFYHLAMRGFEPLLPKNWMIDFRTLPLSLYATDDNGTPLILPHKDNEFRGIRALRDLMDLGENVRGRMKAASPRAREPEIRRRILAFFQWALTDAGIHSLGDNGYLPALITIAMKPRQTTSEAIQELSSALHGLARTWQSGASSTSYPVFFAPDLSSDVPFPSVEDDDRESPTLYGLLICSSLVMIVTKSLHHPQNANTSSTPLAIKTEGHDPVSTLRVIATLDFSRRGLDVWNALALAIVCVCVRNMMMEYRRESTRRISEEGVEDVYDPDA